MRKIILVSAILLLINSAWAGEKNTFQQSSSTETANSQEMPSLLLHLPDAENAAKRAVLISDTAALTKTVGSRTIVPFINFDNGTEAVSAAYDNSRLLIVEFQTPQIAIDEDAKIKQKLEELKPTDTIYRKEGNYAVFVFDAPNEEFANGLLDQVKYEKTVQWLGENPYPFIEAERQYTLTMGSVVLTVFKASGLALLAALVLGGVFGATIFYLRRKEQEALQVFSDAGGMMRLNLDDMTRPVETVKLLKD
jgi:hypothetical protein